MHIDNFKSEIYRKLVHLSSTWIPLMLIIKGKQITLIIIFISFVMICCFEILRKKSIIISKITDKFSIIFRESELKGSITGASYFLLASFLVTAFFPMYIAVMSLFILIISDSAAAIIGKKWGKLKIGNKTLEGSIAFFIASLAICVIGNYFLNNSLISSYVIVFSCLCTTILELFAKKLKIDDNLLIPLSFASFIYILS